MNDELERLARDLASTFGYDHTWNSHLWISMAKKVKRREIEARIDELNKVPPLHKAEGFNYLRIRALQQSLKELDHD